MLNIFLRLAILILILIAIIIIICYYSNKEPFLTDSDKKIISNLI